MVSITPAAAVSDIEFGLGLLTSFGAKVDVVGIYSNTGFTQQFAKARPLRAIVRETSRVMEHPVETGAVLADHHIINPVEIDLPMIVKSTDYSSVYTQIRQAFTNATSLSVKTRTGVYSDMILMDMPHEEEPDRFDAITITLRLRQVIFIVAGTSQVKSNYSPVSPLNASTISSGLQSAVSVAQSVVTSVSSVASYASAIKKFY